MSSTESAIKVLNLALEITPASGARRTWRVEPMLSGLEGTIAVVMPTSEVKFVANWMGAPIGDDYILWRKWKVESLDDAEAAIKEVVTWLCEQTDYMLGLAPLPESGN